MDPQDSILIFTFIDTVFAVHERVLQQKLPLIHAAIKRMAGRPVGQTLFDPEKNDALVPVTASEFAALIRWCYDNQLQHLWCVRSNTAYWLKVAHVMSSTVLIRELNRKRWREAAGTGLCVAWDRMTKGIAWLSSFILTLLASYINGCVWLCQLSIMTGMFFAVAIAMVTFATFGLAVFVATGATVGAGVAHLIDSSRHFETEYIVYLNQTVALIIDSWTPPLPMNDWPVWMKLNNTLGNCSSTGECVLKSMGILSVSVATVTACSVALVAQAATLATMTLLKTFIQYTGEFIAVLNKTLFT